MFSKRIFMFCVYGLMAVAMSAKAQLEEVIVVAHPLAEGGLAQAVEVLEGEELDEVKAGSLGETLAGTAGVQSSSFGTAVGRPVIHGLGATRVKTTQDQIDTLDVSVVSGDHAVTTDAFIADRISVLKGSSTLLYGSGAIGGVVDVDTGRHALTVPEEFSGRAEARFSDVDDGTTLAARLDGRLSDNVAWHVDAFSRDGDDYEIPGFVESARFIAAEEAEEEEEGHDEHEEEGHDEEEEARDILEGSRNERSGGAVSLSFVGDRSHFSVALSGLTGEYGLVGGHGHHEEGHDEDEEEHHDDEDEEHHDDEEEHHDEEEEGVGILDMEQTRVDIRAGYQFDGSFIEKVDFLFGQNDYEHLEIEGNGEAGTEFSNEAWEARFELHHTPILGFDGLFGLQFNDREFSALGEEAFVQPVDSSSQALFWIGEKDTDFGSIEAGFRFESTDHEPFGGSTQPDTSFDTFSASFGLISEVSEQLTLSFLIDSSSRAPAIEELYSEGPHLATQTFDIGDPNLNEEDSLGFSATANYASDSVKANATVYYTDFSDFIYQSATGEEDDDLPVFEYVQSDAEFFGVDLSVEVQLGELAGGQLSADVIMDFVSAELSNQNSNLPRIPADRLGLGLRWKTDDWTVRTKYLHVDDQNEVAPDELATDGYEDLSLFVSRALEVQGLDMEIFFHGKNLTDDEQRYHASFVKDTAPAPGRSLEAGVRVAF